MNTMNTASHQAPPGLLNLNELDLSLLVELLTKLAPDVMNLHEEEQVGFLQKTLSGLGV